MQIIKENIVLISIVATFFATCVTIFYTRKNLKTSKYIDTITSERIKWLSVIRDDIAELSASIYKSLIIYSDEIESIQSQNPSEDYINDINYKYFRHSYDSPTKMHLMRILK